MQRTQYAVILFVFFRLVPYLCSLNDKTIIKNVEANRVYQILGEQIFSFEAFSLLDCAAVSLGLRESAIAAL
uniref:Secreted protein n=1 Tax=Parascaris univalens TaxID=6257 RepID=A0A915A014_PARUN